MAYDLWDVESGNIVTTFETEREALKVVSMLLTLNGPGYAGALSLGYEGEDGSMYIVAEGSELAKRAAHASASPPVSLPHTSG